MTDVAMTQSARTQRPAWIVICSEHIMTLLLLVNDMIVLFCAEIAPLFWFVTLPPLDNDIMVWFNAAITQFAKICDIITACQCHHGLL